MRGREGGRERENQAAGPSLLCPKAETKKCTEPAMQPDDDYVAAMPPKQSGSGACLPGTIYFRALVSLVTLGRTWREGRKGRVIWESNE